MTRKLEILQLLKTGIEKAFPERIKDVVLFGSQAENKENEDSDFDILILTKDIFDWREKGLIRDICYDVSVDFEILIDSKIISQIEVEKNFWGKHPLITDALNFGIYAR